MSEKAKVGASWMSRRAIFWRLSGALGARPRELALRCAAMGGPRRQHLGLGVAMSTLGCFALWAAMHAAGLDRMMAQACQAALGAWTNVRIGDAEMMEYVWMAEFLAACFARAWIVDRAKAWGAVAAMQHACVAKLDAMEDDRENDKKRLAAVEEAAELSASLGPTSASKGAKRL